MRDQKYMAMWAAASILLALLGIALVIFEPGRVEPAKPDLPAASQTEPPAGSATGSSAARGDESSPAGSPESGKAVGLWLTTPDRRNLLTRQPDLQFEAAVGLSGVKAGAVAGAKANAADGAVAADVADVTDKAVIEVEPAIAYQTMKGFGAAVTGSSAYLINGLPANRREALLRELFTEDGLNLSYVRHTIGASDFSVDGAGAPASYTYDDTEAGVPDWKLARFTAQRDAGLIALLSQISALSGRLQVMGTPWTAPPWMKYGEAVHNGWYLNYEDSRVYEAYADYFVKYIQAYAAAGVPIDTVTVQNEPGFTSSDYPSMSMGAEEQARFIGRYLGPAFERSGIATNILTYDHNWDQGEAYVKTVLGDKAAARYLSGSAYHCYAGEPDAMSRVHEAYPDKAIYFTECSGGGWSGDFGSSLTWLMSKLIIGAPRNWAETVLLWNIALDPSGGPANGGCQDCRGVVEIDPASGLVSRNPEYYALGHAAKFVDPGAVRIGSSPSVDGVDNVAYRNPDGSLVVIADNASDAARAIRIVWQGRSFAYTLPVDAAATFKWQPDQGADAGGTR